MWNVATDRTLEQENNDNLRVVPLKKKGMMSYEYR